MKTAVALVASVLLSSCANLHIEEPTKFHRKYFVLDTYKCKNMTCGGSVLSEHGVSHGITLPDPRLREGDVVYQLCERFAGTSQCEMELRASLSSDYRQEDIYQ